MSEAPKPVETATQKRKNRRKINKKIRKLQGIKNSDSKIYVKKSDSKVAESKNKHKRRRYGKNKIEGDENKQVKLTVSEQKDIIETVQATDKPKRKRYRGKKKKGNGVVVAPPPKLKELKPEDLSSNWKSLMKTIPVRLKSSTYVPPSKRLKLSEDAKEKEKKEVIAEKAAEEEDDEIWFDDVDKCLLDVEPKSESEPGMAPDNTSSTGHSGVTRIIGIDCEMVGVGHNGLKSNLARVSIVNHFGNVLFDSYVEPMEEVTDYRTEVSGIRPEDLVDAPTLEEVQAKVAKIIDKRILVGHDIKHDLKALMLTHPRHLIRDTSKFHLFQEQFGGNTPGLKKLIQHYFDVKVQSGEHCSIEDAQGTVRLYTMFRTQWEQHILDKREERFRVPKTDKESSKPKKKKQPRSIDVSALFKK